MQALKVQLPWEQPGWLEAATTWIHARLEASRWRASGPVELLHQRAWSTFARVPTDQGTAYFKAPAPPYYEAALTEALSRWRPDCTARLLGVDVARGWLLSADAGETLRAVSDPGEQIEHWVKLLPQYAELQMAMAGHVTELLGMGVSDRRLANFARLYANLLEETESLMIGLPDGLTREEHRRLLDLRPQVAAWCEQLAGYGLADTLTHEEIHDSNVLFNGEGYIFTDWSDSSVAHPFFTILVTMRAAAHRLKLAEDGPEITRLRDAYLESWTKFATRKALSEAFELAYRLAMINRALSWQESIGPLSDEQKEPYADNVPGWLQDFLIAGPVTSN